MCNQPIGHPFSLSPTSLLPPGCFSDMTFLTSVCWSSIIAPFSVLVELTQTSPSSPAPSFHSSGHRDCFKDKWMIEAGQTRLHIETLLEAEGSVARGCDAEWSCHHKDRIRAGRPSHYHLFKPLLLTGPNQIPLFKDDGLASCFLCLS